ncbi:PAS domain-containing sensor histidine kinase [Haloarcula hispanica]|nr:PAS domain-containing sensor histidine kinase [Haloarcula hispanica]
MTDNQPTESDAPLFEQRPQRLQLLFDHERNQELLGNWLADRYSVATPSEPTLDEGTDICLVDNGAFARHRDALDEWKQRTEPVFSPVLLVSDEPISDDFDPEEWKTLDGLYIIDDVISVPIEKSVLHRRLENLLERRALSRTLDSKYRRSEERFSSLFAALPDPAFVTGPDATLKYANDAFRTLCGDPTDVVGEALSSLKCFDAAAVETVESSIETVTDGESLDAVEIEFTGSAGDRRWAELNANAVTVDGEPVVTVVLRDVTARKSREQELTASEQKFRSVFEGTNDALLLADDDGYYVDANPAACDLLRLDESEIVGRRIAEFATEDIDFESIWDTFIREGGMAGEFEIVAADGTTRIVEYRATANVTPGRHLSALRDVTERKQMEADLRESELRFKQMAANLDEVIWMIDDTGDLLYVSPGFEELTGRSTAEVESDPLTAGLKHVHPEDANRMENEFRALYDDLAAGDCDDAYHFEYRLRSAAGTTRWVTTDAYPVTTTTGQPTRVVGIIDDITSRKRRERELKRQNDRLEEFAGIVSHDLRNPIQVITARLDLLDVTPEQADHVDAINRATQRMERLIEDLLSLAREGEMVSDTEEVELSAIARRAWETVHPADATLNVESDGVVEADVSRLQQLFENFFRNSVEHGRHATADDAAALTVSVGITSAGFYVEDDGPGIAADQRDRVFERGYSTQDNGTGFGLNIVADIVAAHGWTVVVTDGRTGGARFEISGVDLC